MRTNQIGGMVHDLIHLNEDFHPLNWIWLKEKYDFNLLGKRKFVGDSLAELMEYKKNWFLERIKKLRGNLGDFQKANIHIFGAKEKIEIVYKNQIFSEEKIYKIKFSDSTKEFFKEMREQKKRNAS